MHFIHIMMKVNFYVKRFAQIQKETTVIRYIVRTTRNKQQQKN